MVAWYHTGIHYLHNIRQFDNVVVALPDLATDNTIHAFIYSLKPWLKGFVKAQA